MPEAVDWLLGEQPVPIEFFLVAVDIVLADSKRQAIETAAFLKEVRSRHRNG